MINQIETSLVSLDDLKQLASSARVVYFHVYESAPDPLVKELFTSTLPGELLLLLNTASDQGFLKNTPVTVDVTPDRQFISKPLIELRGLGAWARGILVGFETNRTRFHELVGKGRDFAFGSQGATAQKSNT